MSTPDDDSPWKEILDGYFPDFMAFFFADIHADIDARATQRHPTTRLQAKVQLIRHLYTRGLTRQQILDLFRFLDWVLTLPEALEQQFQVELAHVEAETHMPYITSIERMGIEKGLQQGLQEGIQQGKQQGLQEGFQQGEAFMLARLLTRRFGPLPGWATERLAQASREELEQWLERVLDAQRLEDVFATT